MLPIPKKETKKSGAGRVHLATFLPHFSIWYSQYHEWLVIQLWILWKSVSLICLIRHIDV